MDRVRIGIVGTGNIAPMNVRGYLDHPRCDVVAVCDPRREKAERMAAEWGVERVYDSLDALLADDEIDAVEILTPTFLHHEHVIAAARAREARLVPEADRELGRTTRARWSPRARRPASCSGSRRTRSTGRRW